MQEKKKFILAVPTVIIIIIFIIAMSYMIYNKNFKPLDKEEALSLARQAVNIDNFSCQIVTQQGDTETTTDYKRKGNMVYMQAEDYKEYLNIDTTECVYIDDENKEAYMYESDSVLENYNGMIYSGIQSLEDESFSYNFNKYEKVNGIDCAAINLTSDSIDADLWLDRDNGMVTKFVITYKAEELEDSSTTYIYRYQIGNVTDDNVTIPDLTEYTVIEM